MRFGILLLFITVSLTELVVLVQLSRQIGIWWTILLIICTVIIGTIILRQQGLKTLASITQSMLRGVGRIEPLIEGFFLIIAGAFLITPGIITDLVGFLLLIPPFRRQIAQWGLKKILSRVNVHVHTTNTHQSHEQQTRRNPPQNKDDGPIIDGEFERIDEKTRR